MKKLVLFVTIILELFAAKISFEAGNKLDMRGFYFQDNCAIVFINGKVVGEKNDINGSDIIKFDIYNDGKLIKSIDVAVPLEQAKELNLSVKLENIKDRVSPGIAIESEELGIYVDPLKLEKKDENCSDFLSAPKAKKELQSLCPKLRLLGIKCE
ncbi:MULTISPECIES: hypothetical protein [unclassified Nitratiruptor]|uniref:hypothetical protein n=1 Tax=unclassified Nitratiruptor TaxID=2624044 RepID=UPI001915910B|nr:MULTISPECIES: hypothetical protein [unclassified Nitratiruptor]